MATQGQNVDAIDAIFGNPFVKAALAALTVVAAILRYIKESGERESRAAMISERYGLKGPIFWTINRLPHILHRTVAVAVLIVAFLEVAILVDQYTLNKAVSTALPAPVRTTAEFLSNHFVGLFLAALFLYIMFELRALEQFLAWLIGLFPRKRNTLGWANAQWQIAATADERRILAPSPSHVETAASRLIEELVSAPRNESLALRPIKLSEDSAANVLYFGHVVEQYLAANASISLSWTVFYQALAEVAETQAAPFSPEGIRDYDTRQPFLTVLLQANAHIPDHCAQIPNDAGLENALELAFNTLRQRHDCDARNLAKAFLLTPSYARVLRRSASFLAREGMRRQFAKLFILWNILPEVTRPNVFRIPFNAKMFLRYLDTGVIRHDGDRFDFTTEPVLICFEAVQKQILSRVLYLLDQTKDGARVTWREDERTDVRARHLDWTWWVYYRADQQAYHDARQYETENWTIEGSKEVVAS